MLKFDPYRWLAEYAGHPGPAEGHVATVAAVASATREMRNSVSPLEPATLATTATERTLGLWRNRLSTLSPDCPAGPFNADEWACWHCDALWLLDSHGANATRLGWTAADLFSIEPRHVRFGGLADRLGGARELVMDASRARWRSPESMGFYNRASGPALPLAWELETGVSRKELTDGGT